MWTTQAARLAGVNTQTLRYYERRGLLPEPARSSSGYRTYGPEAVRIVRFVKRAQELGFTLADIEVLLELAGGGPQSCSAARTLASEKIDDLKPNPSPCGTACTAGWPPVTSPQLTESAHCSTRWTNPVGTGDGDPSGPGE